MNTVVVPAAHLRTALQCLQDAGKRQEECVVLWIGRRLDGDILIEQTYRPEQKAGMDFFEIPRSSMQALLQDLRLSRSIVAAQIHTHPGAAFHSQADDSWAIVRHEGALSLVLPNFALRTNAESFLSQVAVFRLNSANEWAEVPAAQLSAFFSILHECRGT